MNQTRIEQPYILALETATPVASVALFSGSILLGLEESHVDRTHAKIITPMIQSLLKRLEITPSELSAIAVAKGPGSYTGLRVGVSTAKGLCLGLEKPLLTISSLEALAWQARELAQKLDAYICPMIDARRMEVFTACFDADMRTILSPHSLEIEDQQFQQLLTNRKVIFLGSGAKKAKEILGRSENGIVLSEQLSSASSIGLPIFHRYQSQQFEDLVHFEPFYLKEFVATKPKDKWAKLR